MKARCTNRLKVLPWDLRLLVFTVYANVAMDFKDVLVNEGDWDPVHRPLLWARLRDDIYVPWTYGIELLEVFHEWFNSKLPGIKFTKSFSSHGIEFLNSFVYCIVDNILQTKPYSKPSDEHMYF